MRLRAVLVVLAIGCATQPGTPAQPRSTAAAEPDVSAEEISPPPTAERAPPSFSAALTQGFADACGSCHDSELATAKPEALAVFDLQDPAWLVALAPDKRQCTLDRLGGKDFVADAAKTDLLRLVDQLAEG